MGRDDEHSEEIDWFDLGSADEPAGYAPPRQPWPRWFTLAIVAAVVVAVGLAVLNHQRRVRSAAPVATPPTSRVPAAPRTAAPVTVTPVPSPPAVSVTRLGHPLLGETAGWELVGRGDGVLVRIQPAAGRITSTALPVLATSGPVFLVPGSDEVLVRPLDNVSGYLVSDGKPARQLPPLFNLGGPVFPGPASNQVWVQSPSGDQTAMVLATLDGARLPARIPIPEGRSAFDASPDGAGYLLFVGVSGVYDARPDGLRRITTGALLAVGPTGWLVAECDERYRCQTVLIDRVHGSRRIVAGGPIGRNGNGVISPDGSSAAMLTADPDGHSRLYLLDLASGKRRPLAASVSQDAFDAGFTFSPDGRWLFVVTDGGALSVVNCRTGAIGSLGVTLPALSQLVLRPAR